MHMCICCTHRLVGDGARKLLVGMKRGTKAVLETLRDWHLEFRNGSGDGSRGHDITDTRRRRRRYRGKGNEGSHSGSSSIVVLVSELARFRVLEVDVNALLSLPSDSPLNCNCGEAGERSIK